MNERLFRLGIAAAVIALAIFGIYEEVTHVGAEHWLMGTWYFQALSWFVALNTLVYAVLGATKVTARRLPKGGVSNPVPAQESTSEHVGSVSHV